MGSRYSSPISLRRRRVKSGEAPRMAHRARRSQFPGWRICTMLLFNVIAAYAGVYVFLRWNDGQWMLSRSTVTPQSDEVARQVITPEFSELARKLMAKGDVPGLSVGVVRWSESSASNADVEFGSWGIMSEQGANVTADVSTRMGSRDQSRTRHMNMKFTPLMTS